MTGLPEQALAVFELLDDLREVVSSYYACQIQDLTRQDRQTHHHPPDDDPHDPF